MPVPRHPQSTTVDLVVVGSGTGLAAALSAHEAGLSVVVVEKSRWVGGSTARSGGAFWIPANPVLTDEGSGDTYERGAAYLEAVVAGSAPAERWRSFLDHGTATIEMLRRTTPMRFFWARGYADYHPELPGGAAVGRSCECRPLDLKLLGPDRKRLRPAVLSAPVPMPVTGADYKWLNLMAKNPRRAIPRIATRIVQGVGGLVLGREYAAGGQAIAAGMFAGVRRAGIPVWTETSLERLLVEGDRVVGVELRHDETTSTVRAERGVVLATGGFDHNLPLRHAHHHQDLQDWSLGADTNTGDGIHAAQEVGAGTDLMEQVWWFPAVAPIGDAAPQVLLAERSLPGSLIVDDTGRRFINESRDYMSFGQRALDLARERGSLPNMWLVFDQRYRNSYVFAGTYFPRAPLPKSWYEAGVAHRAGNPRDLARSMGVDADALHATLARFNQFAAAGVDDDFHRGASAYDRYYGDPTVTPNPNLRPLSGNLYAVKIVLSDLGTCGGIQADGLGRALSAAGVPIPGLYAIGNAAANAFGRTYPGAGATIGQGLVYGYVVGRHAAGKLPTQARPEGR
ncbi:3-ketosteroid-delta-1-dehydrogenase [Micromonospora polyrhachis]|uniref:Succinate dehydrogenase/fumarate reductase flavoprotein subunit n=1 Tax=Micromonospora polyrhachis TaxID=1282883 RepID=A0A7W7SPE0_9ACTN|nr:3-ketosteroid-delta-1-dehydrogenase [Micromonospora polyrhachis]MBB4957912.1 succinate dehydrogenase/fumarate reductase flavoprotein subunit [Micromonospora polyrhachis]